MLLLTRIQQGAHQLVAHVLAPSTCRWPAAAFNAAHSSSSPICKLARAYSSTQLESQLQNGAPVGGYTPVTKQLWLERLQHAASSDHHAGASAAHDNNAAPGKSVTYAFSSDPVLRELYRNPWDKIRVGRVFEDLDSLAGSVAYQHCFSPGRPSPLLVTASVDEIVLKHPISVHQDVTMHGSVAWTGSSSLDIIATINQPQYEEPSLTALFSFGEWHAIHDL